MQSNTDDEELDILAVAGALWRGRPIVIACAMLFAIFGGYYALKIATPKYVATTTVALQLQSEPLISFDSILSGVSTEAAAINTELEVIRSRGLVEKLVRALDLQDDAEFNPALRTSGPLSAYQIRITLRRLLSGEDVQTAADIPDHLIIGRVVDEVRNAIAVYNQKNTYVFVIQVKSTDPGKSARIANALADLYIQEQIDVKYQATENAVTWLSERVASLAIELEDQEKAVTDFQSQMQVGSIEGAEAMSQRVRDMRDRSLTTAGDLARVNAQLARLQAAFDAQDVEALAAALDDPNLRRLLDQARNGDGEARTAVLARTQVTIDRLTVESQRIEQQLGIVNDALHSLEDQFNADSQQLIELQQLQRDSDATRTLYEIFLTRLKETSVQRGLQQADTRVLSEATPGIYVEPRKSRIVLVSFILGAMVGAVASLVRQFLYSGVRTIGELEQVSSHPVLGQIPLMPIRERKALLPYLGESSTSVAVEAVRNLRTSLLLSNLAKPPQVILTTSGIPGDGKTTLALSLAHNLAGLGKKVLLLDGDIRRRTLNEYFSIPENQMGWNELGPREDENFRAAVYREPGLDADILVASDSRMNAADVFSSEDFRALLADLRRNYDYIVLDTPPLLVVPDSRIIAPLVDAILVSVAWNKTPRHVVKDVVRMLGSEDPNKIGFVLTQVSATGMRRYGDAGHYGAYGGYGHGYYAK